MYIQKYNKYKDKYHTLKNKLYGGYDESDLNIDYNVPTFIIKTHKLLINATHSIISNKQIRSIEEGKRKYKDYIKQLFFLTHDYHDFLILLIDDFNVTSDVDEFKTTIIKVLKEIETNYKISIISDFNLNDGQQSSATYVQQFSIIHSDNPDIKELNKLVEYLTDEYSANSGVLDLKLDSLELIKKIRDKIFRRRKIILSHNIPKKLIILFEFILVHLMSKKNMKYYINVILFALRIIVKK